MQFGEKLVNLRESRGMSQEELAEKLDVTRQTISNWENDKVKIDVEKAIEICRIFGVDLNSLFLTDESSDKLQNTAAYNAPVSQPNKKVILFAIISCLILILISVAILVVSSILLSQNYSDRMEPSMMSTFAAHVGFIAQIICCLITALVSAAALAIIIRQSKKY